MIGAAPLACLAALPAVHPGPLASGAAAMTAATSLRRPSTPGGVSFPVLEREALAGLVERVTGHAPRTVRLLPWPGTGAIAAATA
jgi:hypothetical protein